MANSRKSILLVDDEPDNLFLLEALLGSEGYSTLRAESGAEALLIVQSSQPDLILLDVMMPEMSGFEVCRQLRLETQFANVPVIFLTALDNEQSRLRGLELMGDDYLTKPINAPVLLAKIASTLRLSEMRSQHFQAQTQQLKEQIDQSSAAQQIDQYLREQFRLFVPEQYLQRLAQGGESVHGNTKEEEITVLFCDIRGFATIAEAQLPSQTFDWLNAFFTQMVTAIAAHHGFIDKFLGDALMAVFDRKGYHAQDALSAAVRMRQNLSDFNGDRHQYNLEHQVNIGIGVHTGRGLIGMLGSANRMEPTVIGDVVNTASRLEELTKLYGCSIIASDVTVAQINQPELFHLRWIDHLALRGKQQVNQLYEVMGTQAYTLDPAKVSAQGVFEQGMQSWKQGKYTAALRYFQQVIEQNPTDAVAILYTERCQRRIETTMPK